MKKISFSLLMALILSFGAISCSDDDDDVINVTEVKFVEKELALKVGEEKEFSVTIKPTTATNKNLLWESKNKEVATVEKGKVTAIAVGTTQIIVTSADGKVSDTAILVIESLKSKYKGTLYAFDEDGNEAEFVKNVPVDVEMISTTKSNVKTKVEIEGLAVIPIEGELETVKQADGSYKLSGTIKPKIEALGGMEVEVKLNGSISDKGAFALEINVVTLELILNLRADII